MKIKEIQEIEAELITDLRKRAAEGDNIAAQVLFEHLRQVSAQISAWKQKKDEKENRGEQP